MNPPKNIFKPKLTLSPPLVAIFTLSLIAHLGLLAWSYFSPRSSNPDNCATAQSTGSQSAIIGADKSSTGGNSTKGDSPISVSSSELTPEQKALPNRVIPQLPRSTDNFTFQVIQPCCGPGCSSTVQLKRIPY